MDGFSRLRDLRNRKCKPGSELPGYYQISLRETERNVLTADELKRLGSRQHPEGPFPFILRLNAPRLQIAFAKSPA